MESFLRYIASEPEWEELFDLITSSIDDAAKLVEKILHGLYSELGWQVSFQQLETLLQKYYPRNPAHEEALGGNRPQRRDPPNTDERDLIPLYSFEEAAAPTAAALPNGRPVQTTDGVPAARQRRIWTRVDAANYDTTSKGPKPRHHAALKRSWRWSTTQTKRGSVWVSSRAPSILEHVKGTAWRWRRTMCTPGSTLPRSPPSYIQRATTSMPPYSRRASNRVEAIPEGLERPFAGACHPN